MSKTFNADNAKRLVEEYYARGTELSVEWLAEHTYKALSIIENAAKNGMPSVNYEVNIQDDKYNLVKEQMLLNNFQNLKFDVSVSDKIIKDGPLHITHKVFTINW